MASDESFKKVVPEISIPLIAADVEEDKEEEKPVGEKTPALESVGTESFKKVVPEISIPLIAADVEEEKEEEKPVGEKTPALESVGTATFWKCVNKGKSFTVPQIPFFKKEKSSAAEIKTPKVLVAYGIPRAACDAYVAKLGWFGHVRSISFSGSKLTAEFSSIREAQEAVNYFEMARFSLDEPKRVAFCQDTIKVKNFKASIPVLYEFMMNEIGSRDIKVFESPEEDDVKYVDISESGSAMQIAKSLSEKSLHFPWGFTEFSVGRPYFSRMEIEPVDLIRGTDTRTHATMSNIPIFFNPELFKKELTCRLQERRAISLDAMTTRFDMPFDSMLQMNDGVVYVEFKTPEHLLMFYEEFHGFEPWQKHSKRFRVRFSAFKK